MKKKIITVGTTPLRRINLIKIVHMEKKKCRRLVFTLSAIR